MKSERVVLVTGGSRGWGPTITLRYAQPGTTVVVNYAHDGDAANATAGEASRRGAEVILAKTDMGEPAGVNYVLERGHHRGKRNNRAGADFSKLDRGRPGGNARSGRLINTMTAEAVDEKLELIRKAAGNRISAIELSIRPYMTAVTADVEVATTALAGRLHLSEQFLDTSPFALIGPPAKIAEDLLERRERWGFSYIVVSADDIDAFAPVVAALT